MLLRECRPGTRVSVNNRLATIKVVSGGSGFKASVCVEFDDPTEDEREFPSFFNTFRPSDLREVGPLG